jgi:hypothetical protein
MAVNAKQQNRAAIACSARKLSRIALADEMI